MPGLVQISRSIFTRLYKKAESFKNISERNSKHNLPYLLPIVSSEKAKLNVLLEASLELAKVGGWDYDIKTAKLIYTNELKKIIEVSLDFIPTIEFGIGLYKEGENRNRIKWLLNDSIQHGTSFDEEFIIITAKGNEKWVRAICNPQIRNGKCNGLRGTFQDIHEKKSTELELQLKNTSLNAILESSVDIISVLDKDGKLIYLSKSVEEILGYTREELVGKSIFYYVYPADLPYTLSQMEFGKEKGYIKNLENRLVKKNGAVINLSWSIKWDDQFERLYIIGRDITLQKQEEAKVRALNKELRELSEYMQNAIEIERAEIAKEIHDNFSQNLVALSLSISWLKNSLEGQTEKVKAIFDDQLDITMKLIASSRVLFNSLHPKMLDELGLDSAIRWFAKPHLKLSDSLFSINTNLDVEKLSDETNLGLFRIFQEGFVNAIKYSRATQINVSIYEMENKVIMNIEDDGVGFDYTNIDTKQHHGLLVMRERAYAIGGTVEVISTKGAGTIIKIEVPL
jgi:PAS domain S-box-containing protein